MSATLDTTERRVVPRWRKFEIAAKTGELASGKESEFRQPTAADLALFKEKLAAWGQERNVATAAEVVASAVVLEQHSEAREAAEWILQSTSAKDAIRRLAQVVVRPSNGFALPHPDQAVVAKTRIRYLRDRLRNEPRNPIAWSDLAREYTILGLPGKAADAMFRAVVLVRGNRFVLRAAARLFTHLGDPDAAHDLLSAREATKYDPWLLASEIAVASVAGRRSKFIKKAQKLLADWDGPPFHVSELGSALGTLELAEGSLKQARRLLRGSLTEPNDNAVAQAEWISRFVPGVISVEAALLATPYSFEARSLGYYGAGDWSAALSESGRWQMDEPFSGRPAVFGSFVASFALGNYAVSRDLALSALETNPGDPALLNNLTVALANLGDLDEAVRRFRSIDAQSAPAATQITLTATRGLLLFRSGELEAGRAEYYAAIEAGKKSSFKRLVNLAAVHLMFEEVSAASQSEFVKRALSRITNPIDLDIRDFVERVRLISNRPEVVLRAQ